MNIQLEQLKSEVMSLPLADRAWLAQTLIESLNGKPADSAPSAPLPADSVLGQFADEDGLLDQIVEDAMQTRAQQPLRLTDG
jgi:hypothetical protein